MTLWSQLIVSILGGFVAAYFTALFGLRGHYSKHFFELKVQAYSRILEALHNLKSANRDDLEYYCTEAELREAVPEGKKTQVHERWLSANREIDRAVDMGGFIICSDAVQILEHFQHKLKETIAESESVSETYAEVEILLDRCLSKFKPIAHRDLERTSRPDNIFQ